MSKYSIDYDSLQKLDRQALLEFDEEIARSIERQIEQRRLEEEEARRKKARKKRKKRT